MSELVRIPLAKAVLYLTKQEFQRALRRGRAIERARRNKKRAEGRALQYERALVRMLGHEAVSEP